jgi:hypothetical protein
MSTSEKIFVVFYKQGWANEFLTSVKPYHLYSDRQQDAMLFTEKQAQRIVKPLNNESIRYHGYKKYGIARVGTIR